MANKVLVFIEQRNGEIKKSSIEAARTGAEMAAKLNTLAEAVVIGNEINNIDNLGGYGISKVIHYKNSELSNYSSSGYADLFAQRNA